MLVEGALSGFFAGTLGSLAGFGLLACALLGLAGLPFGLLVGKAFRLLTGDALRLGAFGCLTGLPLGALLSLELCLSFRRSLGGLGL